MIKKILLFISLLLVICCKSNKWRDIAIVSPNGSDTLRIKTLKNKRYIFNGIVDSIPEKHALIDISNVTELGDEIGICWNKDGFKWKLVSFYSDFKYSKLDKKNYYIQDKPIIDDLGIPNHKEYFKENCVVIYLRGNIIRPENGAKIIYM